MAKILVVDDEPIIAVTIADWLDDLGHQVVGPAADRRKRSWRSPNSRSTRRSSTSASARTTTMSVALRGWPSAACRSSVATGHDPASMDPVFSKRTLLAKPYGFETFRQVIAQLLRGEA